MGKHLNLNLTSATNIALFTAGTIDFLQLAIKEAYISSLKATIGNGFQLAYPYVIYGLTSSTSGGNTTFTEGWIFFNNTIYYYPGGTIANPTGSNVFIINRNTVSWSNAFGGDPMTFTVSGTSNVHNDNQIIVATGASGSGDLTNNSLSDYSNLKFILNEFSSTALTLQGTWINEVGGYAATCKIVGLNQLFLSGYISKPSAVSGFEDVIQLPFSPTSPINLICQVVDSTGIVNAKLLINTSGMLRINATTTSYCILSLESISFRIK